jgi:beta-galactosidase GanA
MLGQILSSLGIQAHLSPCGSGEGNGELPCGVTSRMRHGKDGDYLFVFHYSEQPAQVKLDGEYTDVFTGDKVQTIQLEKYGTRVLKRRNK